MRYLRLLIIASLLVSSCWVWSEEATSAKPIKITGKLSRVMAIGGESTGWTVDLEPKITVDGKSLQAVEIDYANTEKLQKLDNKMVVAKGTLTAIHTPERGDRQVLKVSSIKETKMR
jgi:hypothetical protein